MPNNRDETFEQWRQRMLDDTARFIEWGLKNPDQVDWIPMHPVNQPTRLSDRVKSSFWSHLLQKPDPPSEPAA